MDTKTIQAKTKIDIGGVLFLIWTLLLFINQPLNTVSNFSSLGQSLINNEYYRYIIAGFVHQEAGPFRIIKLRIILTLLEVYYNDVVRLGIYYS